METSYQFIIGDVIPATQEAFKRTGINDTYVRKAEKRNLTVFKKAVTDLLATESLPGSFPTTKPVFVSIIQFFTSTKHDYKKRDVDNMAKTILDVLQHNNFYRDDSQVRTLLVSKIVDLERVQQNLGFVYIKILQDGEDIELVDEMLSKAVHLYDQMKAGRLSI